MELLIKNRKRRGISRRKLAKLAGVSVRTVQSIESGAHDANLAALSKIFRALGYSAQGLKGVIEEYLGSKPDSILEISRRIRRSSSHSAKSPV